MELGLIPVLAVFSLFAISGIAYFVAKRTKVPHTVLLVAIGVGLVLLSNLELFGFLKTFTLTPELLFYIFLPTLIFESAYNINIRSLTHETIPVLLLAIVSLFASTLLIAAGLYYLLPFVHFPIPFIVALIFGALISATDPVAVLALFKEYGAPRRLALLFEGESLFNDGTAFAVFLIALEFAIKGDISTTGILEGALTFGVMIVGGTFFGLFMGVIFSKAIGYARSSESVSITLTLVLAHMTFLLSELISEYAYIGSFQVHLSSIIATTMAAMVLGNYGRTRLPFGAEEFVEKFWGQIAFFANSIVFILIGMLAFSLPVSSPRLFIPIGIVVLVVAVARALSIYPVISSWNAVTRSIHKKVPLAWQHVLAWGSLRGALAVTMALLIPPNLVLAGWTHDMSVQGVVLAFTTGCIFVTLFFKATTIGPLMHMFGIGTLTNIESAQYDESRALVYTRVLDRLEHFSRKGYISSKTHEALRTYYASRLKESKDQAGSKELVAKAVLRIWVLGIERKAARDLFTFGEISEHAYKRILSKLAVREEDAEHGQSSAEIHIPRYLDIFERFAEHARRIVGKKSIYQDPSESYMYYRALLIVAHKVEKELARISTEQLSGMFSSKVLSETKEIYDCFIKHAGEKMHDIAEHYPDIIRNLSEKLARFGVLKVEEHILDELIEHKMITPKVYKALQLELEQETTSVHSVPEKLVSSQVTP